LRGRPERQRQLAARRSGRDAEPPEESPPLAPAIAGACGDQRLQRVAARSSPPREVADVGVRLPGLDRVRLLLADRAHVTEADPDSAALDGALRIARIDLGRSNLDSTPLRIPYE